MPAKRSLALSLALLLVVAIPARATAFPTINVVESINPGPLWSYFVWSSTVFNGYVYSSSDDGIHGGELWRSNGNTTELVADINTQNSGIDSSYPGNFVSLGDWLYFSADDGTNGSEIWRTNGTTTAGVYDIAPGGASNPNGLTAFGDWIYFSADDGSNGYELWRTNGTITAMVSNINANAGAGSNPSNLTPFGDWLYFSADDGSNGVELWRTNGTTTALVSDINTTLQPVGSPAASSNPVGFTALGNYLYFAADDGINGNELWRTNGTTTNIVYNINETPAAANSASPLWLKQYGDTLYFQANDGIHGPELWSTNGSTTELVQDWNLWSDGAEGSFPDNLIVFNGSLYFEATDGTVGYELLKFDGSSISLVHDTNSETDGYAYNPIVVGDALYFLTFPGTYYTVGRVDAADNFTSAEISGTNPGVGCMCNTPFRAVGGRLFFPVTNDEMGAEFAYLDESTYQLPETNRNDAPLNSALVMLAALTAAAGLAVRMRESGKRT